jgi:hypothetical protein
VSAAAAAAEASASSGVVSSVECSSCLLAIRGKNFDVPAAGAAGTRYSLVAVEQTAFGLRSELNCCCSIEDEYFVE